MSKPRPLTPRRMKLSRRTPNNLPGTKSDGPRPLIVGKRKDEAAEVAIARAKLRPTIQGALTLASWGGASEVFASVDVNALVSELKIQTKEASSSNLARLEGMLVVQAHSLDAMFNECARRARVNAGEYPGAFDRYMRIALKAQSQCRCTIEALAEIKNPKSFTVVGQANVSNGPQQVNNGLPPAGLPPAVRAPAPAREISNSSNELLEHQNGNGLEQRAPKFTGAPDSSMAPVGEVDGATDSRGEIAVEC